jgi:hypothetical protein
MPGYTGMEGMNQMHESFPKPGKEKVKKHVAGKLDGVENKAPGPGERTEPN